MYRFKGFTSTSTQSYEHRKPCSAVIFNYCEGCQAFGKLGKRKGKACIFQLLGTSSIPIIGNVLT